jgi:Mg-chelatase subunit ChlD
MRTVNYQLSYDEEQILASIPTLTVNALTVPEDVYSDIIGLFHFKGSNLAVFPHMIPFDELYKSADTLLAKDKSLRALDRSLLISSLFDYRRDMITFAESGIIDYYLQLNVPYEDRVKALLMAMYESLKVYAGLQEQAKSNASNQQASAKAEAGVVGDSAFQTSVNILGSLLPEQAGDGAGGGDGYSHCAPGELQSAESPDAALAKALPGLIRELCKSHNYAIFQLAQGFNTALGQKAKEKEDAQHGTDREIRKFRSISDIKGVKAKDLALPEEVFEAKVGTKSLLIDKAQQEKKDEDQLVYILADQSGSMREGAREPFMKASLIALAKNAVDKDIPFAYRFFAGNPGHMERVNKKNWIEFVKTVFARHMDGSTSLHKALHAAAEDVKRIPELSKAELVLITDGTEPASKVELDERVKVKRHAILIDKRVKSSPYCIDSFRDSFDTTIIAETSSVEEALKTGLAMIKAL